MRASQAHYFFHQVFQVGDEFLVAEGFRVGTLPDKGKIAAGFEDAFVHFLQGIEALLSGGCFELRLRDELFLQAVGVDFAAFDEDIGLAFDDLFQLVVTVEKTDHQIVDYEQGGGADEAAGDAIVVADDGVLDGVGEREENNEVEGIELDEFALAGESETDHQEQVDDNRAENFFEQGKSHDEHVFPDVMRWHNASYVAVYGGCRRYQNS